MERVVITVSPRSSDGGLLRVRDAFQQVMDALKLFEDAGKSLGPTGSFEWRLERASASSPFKVYALAESLSASTDVSAHVRRIKSEVSSGLRGLIENRQVPRWMDSDSLVVAKSLFSRNRNGIGTTEIDFEADGDVISIDVTAAQKGVQAVEALTAIDVSSDLHDRQAYGEVEGLMVAAGRYRNQPAVQIRTELYGFVWCSLSPEAISQFGTSHTMAEIWEGKTVGVTGLLSYGEGGKLIKIQVNEIREIPMANPVDLNSLLDPDFTSGLSPDDYLTQLHEGQLV